MLGWYFCVFRQADGGKSPAISSSQLGSRVAEWQTDWSGTDWFDKLSASENAFSLGGDGYPLRYTVKAKILLPYLANGFPGAREALLREPGVALTTKRRKTITIHEKVLDACEPDEWLAVEAWDES
jgi:hypothetical protein